ncbi:MAG: NADP-dependent malic enzyme [bacterium]
MADLKEKALALHRHHQGKLAVEPTVPLGTASDLAIAYTPGVAAPCIEIRDRPEAVYEYTIKSHMVAIVTDGSAVLGLGNIGPAAALPVMEGKAALLKAFGGIDGFPICLDTQNAEEIIDAVVKIAPVFGAIMLEDISAPRCVYIERELGKRLAIPVFHDDQHGTAIVVTAAMTNAARLVKKDFSSMTVVISGTGAAGSAIAKMLKAAGVKTIHAFNKQGVVSRRLYDSYDFVIRELIDGGIIEPVEDRFDLTDLVAGADAFVGVSAPDILSPAAVSRMNPDGIVFAMANPQPEISPDLAKRAGARVVGTGRSDYPNQINNVLVFPGLFRGLLTARVTRVTEAMKLAAAHALATLVTDDQLQDDYIIPSPFDPRVADAIASSIVVATIKE